MQMHPSMASQQQLHFFRNHRRNSISSASRSSSLSATMASEGSRLTENMLESKKRNRDMHVHFRGKIPSGDICLAAFVATLLSKSNHTKIPLPIVGKLYLTARHICFHSYIKDTRQTIPVGRIQSVQHTKSAFVTGIRIILTNGSDQVDGDFVDFIGFIYRQNAERCIREIMGAFKDFDLGSRDSACDLIGGRPNEGHNAIPKSLQKKISRLLLPHMADEDDDDEESLLLKTSSSGATRSTFSETAFLRKREVVFALISLLAFAANLYCVLRALTL